MFKNIKYTLLSMFTVLKHLFKRPVTLEYPEKKRVVNEHFRGMPVINKTCLKCGNCIRVCPTGAIKIHNEIFEIDLKKCIFCGNCSFYCPKGAITMSENYELATDSREKLELTYKIGGEENERNI